MKHILLALACASLSNGALAQSSPNLDDNSISMECAFAIGATVEDLKARLGAESVSAFRGVKCVETFEDKIIVWVQPASVLTRGGGYLYEIERETQQIIARKPQR